MPDRRAHRGFVCARRTFLCTALLPLVAVGQVNPGQPVPSQNSDKKIAPGQPDASNAAQNSPTVAPPPQQSQPSSPVPMEFESHGMEYEALTKNGITVMFAPLPPHIKDYNIIQVIVTNGSLVSWTVKPADFTFVRQDGTALQPVSADYVVESLLEKASKSDVIKLQLLYEGSIYALSNFRPTNGYERRRESAMAQFVKPGFKAAAAASAITLVPTKLKSGDSTDGAIFFEHPMKEKTLGPGRLIAHTCGEAFEFAVYGETKLR
jgi:hypothetical protein